jgi:hypothetical protein
MRPMMRAFTAAVLFAASAAAISAEGPARVVFTQSVDDVFYECGFPLRVQIVGRAVVIFFTDANGDLKRTIEPVAGRLTTLLTNQSTGVSIQVHNSGPGHLELFADGGFSFTTLGPWLGFLHPETLESGAFLIRGRQVKTFPADGDVTVEFDGDVIDLCDILGSASQ